LYLSGAAGSFLQDLGEVRYGTRLDSTIFFRVYGQRLDQRNTVLPNGTDAKDAWDVTPGGFRMDYYPSKTNTFTLQGDFYGGAENKDSLKEGTAEWVDVRNGISMTDKVEIFGNITAGDTLLIKATDEIKPGTPLIPKFPAKQ